MAGQTWKVESTPYIRPRSGEQSDAWREEAERQGRRGTQRITEVRELEPPAEIAAALQLRAGQTAVVRRRVMHLDDDPVEMTDSYYPATVARGTPLAEHRKIRGGAATLVATLGHGIRQVSETVTVDIPSEDARQTLALNEGEPVLVLTRTCLTADERPVEVSVMTMPRGARLTYRTEMP